MQRRQQEVYIVGAARTPIGKLAGKLSAVPAPRLGALAIRAALERAGVRPKDVDDVILGNVLQAGVGQAPARQAALEAGIPAERASALTVNRVCASGMNAVTLGAQQIQTGMAEVVVAGGMENMSRAPHLLATLRSGLKLGDAQLVDEMVYDGLWCATEQHHMGDAAEAIAAKYGITREQQDAYALESQRRAAAAIAAGAFDAEIVPVSVDGGKQATTVTADEGPRPDSTMEALARLRPAFQEGGTVTAGNASLISDGAAAIILAGEDAVRRLELKPLARIESWIAVANEPRWLFDAPALAVRRLLDLAESSLDDYDAFELNEAYAAQCIANNRELAWNSARVNQRGGAIALGHPLGATGARILVTLLYTLQQTGGRRGLAALCHGGGGAMATAVEMV